MAKVPPLAIFNAYTLYTTEANRDGRTWYGLRLGFFSDAVSAKQVAYYVRSDFKTVSVVPVTTIEKERATDLNCFAQRCLSHREHPRRAAADARVHLGLHQRRVQAAGRRHAGADRTGHRRRNVAAILQARARQGARPSQPPPRRRDWTRPEQPKAAAAPSHASRRPPRASGAMRTPRWMKRPSTRRWRSSARTRLEITNDSSGDTGVRHLRVKIDKKGSKFASLIDRLSGKK
jgi:hypothetical protein